MRSATPSSPIRQWLKLIRSKRNSLDDCTAATSEGILIERLVFDTSMQRRLWLSAKKGAKIWLKSTPGIELDTLKCSMDQFSATRMKNFDSISGPLIDWRKTSTCRHRKWMLWPMALPAISAKSTVPAVKVKWMPVMVESLFKMRWNVSAVGEYMSGQGGGWYPWIPLFPIVDRRLQLGSSILLMCIRCR